MIHLAFFYRDPVAQQANDDAVSAGSNLFFQGRGYGAEASVRWYAVQYPSQYGWMEVGVTPWLSYTLSPLQPPFLAGVPYSASVTIIQY